MGNQIRATLALSALTVAMLVATAGVAGAQSSSAGVYIGQPTDGGGAILTTDPPDRPFGVAGVSGSGPDAGGPSAELESGSLPFTGQDLLLALGSAGLLLLVGFALARLSRPRTEPGA